MPSKTKKQHNFMAACAAGAKLDKPCPPRKVAKEFVAADKRKGK